jgi:hypothetical protein
MDLFKLTGSCQCSDFQKSSVRDVRIGVFYEN